MASKINWKKIEKWFIYVSIGTYILFQILSNFEKLSSWFSDSLPITLLGISVIGAIHYLIREVEEIKTGSGGRGVFNAPFPETFHEFIRPYDSISELSIVAFTSYQYYNLIQAHQKKIGHLRLLLFIGKRFQDCSNIHFDIEMVKSNWSSLQKKNQIQNLEIKRIEAHSNFYFSIAESQRALVGLLWPDPGMEDLTAKEAIIFSKESYPKGVKHFQDWFESMWKAADEIYNQKAS